MLTAYDTRMNMEAYIFNEKEGLSQTAVRAASKMTPHISKDGVIDITIPAKKIGRNLFSGFISLGSYNESSKKYFFTQEYMVGNPSVYISPLNMNVLYLGVDNPIDISIPGVSSNSLRLSLSNGTVSKKDDHFLVRPLTTEDCNISVTIINDDKSLSSTAPFRFIVKNKPIPVASIKGIIEDKIKKVEPLSAKELIAAYPSDFDFGVSFEVTGFTVATIRDGLMVSATSNSNLFTDEQRKLIPPLRRGDKLYIQDIRVKGSDGSVLSLKGLIYTID
jgi:gliding motility-associated protein GldM